MRHQEQDNSLISQERFCRSYLIQPHWFLLLHPQMRYKTKGLAIQDNNFEHYLLIYIMWLAMLV